MFAVVTAWAEKALMKSPSTVNVKCPNSRGMHTTMGVVD